MERGHEGVVHLVSSRQNGVKTLEDCIVHYIGMDCYYIISNIPNVVESDERRGT